MADVELTAEQLRELLSYEPKTGLFRWLQKGKGRHVGAIAGSAHNRGYIAICIGPRGNRHRVYAHRLAFLYMTGEWPAEGFDVDHINRLKGDNRWSNLRLLSRTHNQQNRADPYANNPTGFMGVYPMRKSKTGRFFAAIFVDGKTRYLGSFDTPEEGHAAYVEAKRLLHPGCAL